jgi:FkbM family methyltransferase
MILFLKETIKNLASKGDSLMPRPFSRGIQRFYYKARCIEPEIRWLSAWCDPERVAVDIGANRGDYALFLETIAKELTCFEPNPGLAADLERLFEGTSVTIENLALGEEEGEFVLHIPCVEGKELHGWASLEKNFAGQSWKGLEIISVRDVSVSVKRLDDLGIENVGFIKIDVEGHEFATLKGAGKTILRDKPKLLVEIEQRHHRDPIDSIFDWVRSLGYVGKFLDDGILRDLSEFDVAVHQRAPETKGYRNNFLFLPTN